jgi:hypothetical protein
MDRLPVNVTPSILIIAVRAMPGSSGGGQRLRRHLMFWKTISMALLWFNLRLLALAHVSTFCSSAAQESTLLASIIKYVSSAYLRTSFPDILGERSAAATTYIAGPTAEPWKRLAETSR